MLRVQAEAIAPDPVTCYLVGPEGLVWTQPATGEPFILAARTEGERNAAAAFVGGLLAMGLVPYGLPLQQRVTMALFGGAPIRDCAWAAWGDAPSPAGEPGDVLPTVARVIVTPVGTGSDGCPT
jgi:hypothetical protein